MQCGGFARGRPGLQACVQSAHRHQLSVGALFGNAPTLHDDDPVGMLDGGQAVRNDQGGTSLHQALQGVLYQPFGFGVQRRGGFVQDQDGGVLVQRPRNRQPLALPPDNCVAL